MAEISCDWNATEQGILDTLEWEEFSATAQPGLGSFLHAQSATWGANCYFSIQIPPDALPAGAGPTDFSIRFPTKASYLLHQDENQGRGLPLILEMEPHGLVFNEEVTVMATYMPWSGVTLQEFTDCHAIWSDVGLHELFGDPWGGRKLPIYFKFKAPHFSRYEGGGGPPPTEIIPID